MKTCFDLKDDRSLDSRESIRKMQDRLLAEHIRYCRANSPFYRKALAAGKSVPWRFDLSAQEKAVSRLEKELEKCK